MARITVVRPEDRKVARGREFLATKLTAEELASQPAPILDAEARPYFPQGDQQLWLWEFNVDPGYHAPSHVHDVDEILLVLEGELRLGARRCGPGTAIYVPKDTLYAESTGDEIGCRFLVFRGVPSAGMTLKDEFVTARRAGQPARPER